ncbi:hypothetical protein mRhiFer1_008616 [Rhinolophus ferrumequinum]|uniref:Uncharacterized protein n=1 Tax=Rhinolophus ferrumequinum TaxID=59479 RepID=A0A7J7U113_RHIFE|nr:hypothetical protein mRhiFer1_008616 [Rhinolophus ferrumequinum]
MCRTFRAFACSRTPTLSSPPLNPTPTPPRFLEPALPPSLLTVPFPLELHVCHLVLGSCQASSSISSISSPGDCLAAGAHQRDWDWGWPPSCWSALLPEPGLHKEDEGPGTAPDFLHSRARCPLPQAHAPFYRRGKALWPRAGE